MRPGKRPGGVGRRGATAASVGSRLIGPGWPATISQKGIGNESTDALGFLP